MLKMLSEMQIFEIKYSIMSIFDGIVGFCECIKYTFQQVYFMWKSKSIRIWDSCYLIDLIEYRLKKLKECMQEEIYDAKEHMDAEVLKDRQIRLASISECLYQLEVYKDTTKELKEPEFITKFYNETNGNIFEMNLTKEQDKIYTKYLKESYKLENKSLKKFFSIMGENIEKWYV